MGIRELPIEERRAYFREATRKKRRKYRALMRCTDCGARTHGQAECVRCVARKHARYAQVYQARKRAHLCVYSRCPRRNLRGVYCALHAKQNVINVRNSRAKAHLRA